MGQPAAAHARAAGGAVAAARYPPRWRWSTPSTGLPGLSTGELVIVALAAAAASASVAYLSRHRQDGAGAAATAIIGSERDATDVARELALVGIPGYTVVGRIALTEARRAWTAKVPTLGTLGGLAEVIESSGIDLLVPDERGPALRRLRGDVHHCLHLPVRLWELSSFYEEIFGHVPVAEINAAWFQYIMHPKFRAVAPASKRAVDIVVSTFAAVATAPLMLIERARASARRRPRLLRQVRIGEAGRTLTLCKLRTMRCADPHAQWATPTTRA